MRAALATALLLLSLTVAADVWVADKGAIYRIDASSGQVAITVPAVKTLALAVDPADKGPWVLSDTTLSKWSSQGVTRFSLDLKALEMEGASVLAVDGRDGSAWVGEGGGSLASQNKSILHVDAAGAVKVKIPSPGHMVAIGVALDQSVWVLGGKSLYHYTSTGSLLASIDLSPMVAGEPRLFHVDSISAYILIAGEKRVLRVDAHTPANPVVLSALPLSVDALALDEAFGSFYALAGGSVYPVGASGAPGTGIDLSQFGIGGATVLAFDSSSQKLFVGHATGLTRLDRGIVSPLAISLANAVQTIGVAPLRFVTTIQVLTPAAGSVTNPTPTISLQLVPGCSGNPCNFAPAFYQTYSISALLNSQPVGSSFVATAAAGVFAYTPSTPLPEGTNTFVARVTDIFGQTSPDASTTFVVDTVGPSFIALLPVSPAVTNQASITISGRLSEPATLTSGSDTVPVASDGCGANHSMRDLMGS